MNTGKSYFVPTKSNKKIAPAKKRQKRFLTTTKRGRTPLRFFIGEKFKENKPSKDLSLEAVKTIKKLTFKDTGNAQEYRDKVREMKGRNNKKALISQCFFAPFDKGFYISI